MRTSCRRLVSRICLVLALEVLAAATAAAQAPTPVVPSGVSAFGLRRSVQGFVAEPYLAWYTRCFEAPEPSILARGATFLPLPRELLRIQPCAAHEIRSNLAIDETHIYYVDNRGPSGHWALQKRSREANPADASTLLVDYGTSVGFVEINAEYPTVLFAIIHRTAEVDVLAEYAKDTGAVIHPGFEIAPTNTMRLMQYDGKFLYWINNGTLRSDDTTNGALKTLATGVSTYSAYGFNQGGCFPTDPPECFPDVAYVYYGKNHQIFLTDTVSGGQFPQYTSVDLNASITELVLDNVSRLYFFERRAAVPGGPFDRADRLWRLGSSLALIYGPVNNGGPGFEGLSTDITHLYFRNRANDSLLKLPTDAAAIPVRSLRAVRLEVTQGIQNNDNDVSLIAGRRTFVRLHVRSDGATSVPAVGARLDVTGPGGYLGSLEPVNGVNKLLTVPTTPFRRNLNDSFLFEVPLQWTESTYLIFSGTVNPSFNILEDTFANNTATTPILIFSQSARLPLEIISWWYVVGNTLVTGNTFDNLRSEWYMRSMYPLAQQGGAISQPGPGLRTDSRVISDNELVDQVDRTDANCVRMRGATPTKPTDDRNQCACDYAMGQVRAMKAAGTLPSDRYYYSSIGGNAGTLFTRGYAITGEMAACGPMTDTTTGAGAQQNYMAHEVGHLLGRGHPASGAAPVCNNQDAADPNYPYPTARIANSTTVAADENVHMGFDPGDFTTSPKTIRPSSTHGDVMSYCPPHWISNYTYNAMDLWMSLTNPVPAGLPRAAGLPAAAALPGDWLLAYGTLSADGEAVFASVERRSSVAELPPLVPGGYALELRNAGGTVLATHGFSPEDIDDGAAGYANFGLVVPFVPGTRSLRLLKTPSQELATYAVSASPPLISGVGLVGAVQPLQGNVTVAWTASDPDGNPLKFDLFYSFDAGVSWRPVQLSIVGQTVVVDTNTLPGGTGRFRVEASDGAQTAFAESAPFQILRKPPRVKIDSPAEGTHVDWGQVVNFSVSVEDPQGGIISPANISWSNGYRTLGTGPVLSVQDLEVGNNIVTVTVLDSQGMPSFAVVHVIVGDDVQIPGPRLSATPAPIVWQVPGNSSSVVTQNLDVLNIGGGSLPFQATSNQPWLRLNGLATVNGNALATLVVSANATTLPDAAVSVGEITLTNLANPSDVIVVKASVHKGDLVGGNPFSDQDGDGVDDQADDCILAADGPTLPGAAGLNQRDTDGDGIGNICDPDLNNEGIVNAVDLARLKSVFFKADAAADLNGDGVVNAVDLARLKSFFFKPPGPSAKAP